MIQPSVIIICQMFPFYTSKLKALNRCYAFFYILSVVPLLGIHFDVISRDKHSVYAECFNPALLRSWPKYKFINCFGDPWHVWHFSSHLLHCVRWLVNITDATLLRRLHLNNSIINKMYSNWIKGIIFFVSIFCQKYLEWLIIYKTQFIIVQQKIYIYIYLKHHTCTYLMHGSK